MVEAPLPCQIFYNKHVLGVPAVRQWVKNPTAGAWVATEARVRPLPWGRGLKDLALPQLWHRSKLELGLNPWPRLSYVWVQPFLKNVLMIPKKLFK